MNELNHFCYILYSPSLDKFYIGESEDVNRRVFEHNHGIFRNAYTKIAHDWEIYISINCPDRINARKIESFNE